MVLEIHPAAAIEARSAAVWYRERSPRAAIAFDVEVREAFARIAESPAAYPLYLEGTRRFLLRRFPFEMVYRIRDDRVLVVAIAHCKRKPGYWIERTP